MSLAVMDARECRDVMTSDIPNALIQTVLECHDEDDQVMMKIAGVLVDILLADNPDSHRGCVACENGKKVPFVMVLRAICGMSTSDFCTRLNHCKTNFNHPFSFFPILNDLVF